MSVSRTLLAAAAGVLVASSSYAADMMYEKAPTIAPPAPIFYDWSGVYVGLNAGYGWADVDYATTPFIGLAPGSAEGDGFLGGATLGANWQFDRFVFGIEGDFAFSGIDGEETLAPGLIANAESDWLATVRGRAGIAINRILIYGTGGVAFTDIELSIPAFAATDDNTHVGWVAGAGVEYGVTPNLSVKAEYLFADFGDETYAIVPGLTADLEPEAHIIRAGINYRFNLFR